MLHEASTIFKAIEEAWNESGKPTEFTINILEAGEKGFLWFNNRPAIVSISYDQKNQQSTPSKEVSKSDKVQHPKRHPERQQMPAREQGQKNQDNKRRPQPQQQPQPKAQLSQPQPKPKAPNSQPQQNDRKPQQQPQQQQKTAGTVEASTHHNWSQEYADHIAKDLRDLLAILKIEVPFATTTEGRRLHITFEKSFLAAPEEKMLFMSLSYLLIQFIKKHYKKKFKGFSLAIRSKDSAGNDTSQSAEQ